MMTDATLTAVVQAAGGQEGGAKGNPGCPRARAGASSISSSVTPGASLARGGRSEAGGSVAQHLPMPDPQSFDPALLPERQRDEASKFNELGNREVLVEFRPEGIVCDLRVPDDGAGIGQRHLLALREPVGIGEVEELLVFLFGQALPSSLDGTLDPSVLALN